MGNPVIRPAEAGLAEFIALLISGTMDSVISSLCEQERKAAELEQCCRLSAEEFMQHCMTQDQVRAEVIRYFPDMAGRSGRSAVDSGEPYRRKNREQDEFPPVFSLTGYAIREQDVEKCPSGLCFTQEGQEAVTRAAGALAAAQNLAALKVAVARGIPRVFIDHGRIAAKMTIRVEEGSDPVSPRYSRPARKNLVVQPVNTGRPEFLSLKADIISEVEITFKSISR